MTGIMAGRLIAAVLGGRTPAEGTAAACHEWLAGWFSADAANLARFYRGFGISATAAHSPISAAPRRRRRDDG